MINEGEAGDDLDLGALAGAGGEGGPAAGEGLDAPGVIQVSPQDKEAIERVSQDDKIAQKSSLIVFNFS